MTGGDPEVSSYDVAVLAIVAIAGPIGTGELVHRYAGAEDEIEASRSLARLARQGLAGRELTRPPSPGPTGRWTATSDGRALLARHAELAGEVNSRLAGRGFRPAAPPPDAAPGSSTSRRGSGSRPGRPPAAAPPPRSAPHRG